MRVAQASAAVRLTAPTPPVAGLQAPIHLDSHHPRAGCRSLAGSTSPSSPENVHTKLAVTNKLHRTDQDGSTRTLTGIGSHSGTRSSDCAAGTPSWAAAATLVRSDSSIPSVTRFPTRNEILPAADQAQLPLTVSIQATHFEHRQAASGSVALNPRPCRR